MKELVDYSRGANVAWQLWRDEGGFESSQVQLAVLMDIRAELRKLNSILGCSNCIDIPHKLDRIVKNTTKRKYVKKGTT